MKNQVRHPGPSFPRQLFYRKKSTCNIIYLLNTHQNSFTSQKLFKRLGLNLTMTIYWNLGNLHTPVRKSSGSRTHRRVLSSRNQNPGSQLFLFQKSRLNHTLNRQIICLSPATCKNNLLRCHPERSCKERT